MVKRKPVKRKNPLFGSKDDPRIFNKILEQETLALSILSIIERKIQSLGGNAHYLEKQQDYKTAEKISKLFSKLNVKLTDLEEWF